MSESVWEIIAETPWWFYLFVMGFLYLGVAATKPKIIHINQIYTLPFIYLIVSFVCIGVGIHSTFYNWCYWLGACSIGFILGYLQMLARRVKAIKNTNQLYLPGSWAFFIVVIALLIFKFYINYQFTYLTTDILSNPNYAKLFMSVFGFCTGLYVGRIVYAIRVTKVGPYIQT